MDGGLTHIPYIAKALMLSLTLIGANAHDPHSTSQPIHCPNVSQIHELPLPGTHDVKYIATVNNVRFTTTTIPQKILPPFYTAISENGKLYCRYGNPQHYIQLNSNPLGKECNFIMSTNDTCFDNREDCSVQCVS